MNILIDRFTNTVKGLNIAPSSIDIVINVPEDFNPSKIIQVQDGEIQKKNEQGQLLYKINIKQSETGAETFEETTEARTVTKTEPRQITNKWTDENGVEQSQAVTIQEPIEWLDNEPVMVPNMVNKQISLKDDFTQFTVDEIVKSKYNQIMQQQNANNIMYDLFLDESDVDLTYEKHKANTGVAIMDVLPQGEVRSNPISLYAKAMDFSILDIQIDDGLDLYINDVKFVDGKATLLQATDLVYLRAVNTTDKIKQFRSYCIGY